MATPPDISSLKLSDDTQHLDDASTHGMDERDFAKLKSYARALPYAIESTAEMNSLLDLIVRRIMQCAEARDYEPGLLQWDSMLTYWYSVAMRHEVLR